MNTTIISSLQDALREALQSCAPRGRPYAILDFPNHANVGDSAIYLGEAILCREHFGRDPVLVTEVGRSDPGAIARLPADTILFLHGGGNFGDIYALHQGYREDIFKACPNHKTVLMPQSIHYGDESAASSMAEAADRHSDLTLMLRDRESLAFAEAHFNARSLLVPDMAFAIGVVPRSVTPDLDVLGLMRDDVESLGMERQNLTSGLPEPYVIQDWPIEHWQRHWANRLPPRMRALLPPAMQFRKPESPQAYEWLARSRFMTGIAILSRGRRVVTDRLHAHIMSTLLGIPHVTLDNSYGKIRRFSEVWTSDVNFSRVEEFAEVPEHLERLQLSGGPGVSP